MAAGIGDYIRRAVMPRMLVAMFEIRWPGRLRASVVRASGGRGCIELYFAFDDPYSAVALPALQELAARHAVRLVLYPVIERGLPDDPAAEQRRHHAVTDSRRLARRYGRMLGRTTPISAADAAFLASWTEAARDSGHMHEFAALALRKLWSRYSGPLQREAFAELFLQITSHAPPDQEGEWRAKLRQNSRRLQRKGGWESPSARVDGEWFFAHERIPQIEDRLAYLGW